MRACLVTAFFLGLKLALSIVLSLITACSAWTGSAPNESRFARAAESWTGAPLDEMIASWGSPRQYLEDSELEDAGIAIWRSTRGDALIVAQRVATAASVKYVANHGITFWTRGNETMAV
jgi:hypothetical protein